MAYYLDKQCHCVQVTFSHPENNIISNSKLQILFLFFSFFCFGVLFDNLHDYLRFSYPRMVAPSFFCQSETANGLLLRYRSRRRGFVPYVIGQIREVARLYYDTTLTVEVLSADGGPQAVNNDTETGSLQDRESELTTGQLFMIIGKTHRRNAERLQEVQMHPRTKIPANLLILRA